MIQTFSTLCFAFGCQQNVPLIHGEIYEKSTKHMNIICLIAVFIVGVFYMLAGIFGYCTFTTLFKENSDTSGNVLTLYKDDDYLVFAARLASLVTVTFCCPINALPARVSLYNIVASIKEIYREKKQNRTQTTIIQLHQTMPWSSEQYHKQIQFRMRKQAITMRTQVITISPILPRPPNLQTLAVLQTLRHQLHQPKMIQNNQSYHNHILQNHHSPKKWACLMDPFLSHPLLFLLFFSNLTEAAPTRATLLLLTQIPLRRILLQRMMRGNRRSFCV